MLKRYGVLGTECNGVFFTESVVSGGQSLGHIHVEVPRQNANLSDVKQKLAAKAQTRGANVVAQWKYGQRGHSLFDLIFNFKWDTESWHGEGEAICI